MELGPATGSAGSAVSSYKSLTYEWREAVSGIDVYMTAMEVFFVKSPRRNRRCSGDTSLSAYSIAVASRMTILGSRNEVFTISARWIIEPWTPTRATADDIFVSLTPLAADTLLRLLPVWLEVVEAVETGGRDDEGSKEGDATEESSSGDMVDKVRLFGR